MSKTVTFLVFSGFILAASSPKSALAVDDEPGLSSVETLNAQPEVFLVSIQRGKECPRLGKVCLFGNGGGTIAGFDVNPTVGIVTTLARGTQVAAIAPMDQVPEADAWHVEMIARLRARTASAPIIVAMMDYADPEGMARKEATAVWLVESPPVKNFGMRFVFSAEDGFQPRHTYLVRVVQGVGADEKILAEGNFLLE